LLADGAEMSASSGEYDPLDRCTADLAGLAGAEVDAMFKLEKAAHSVGVYVVGDGGTAQGDCVLQDFLQSRVEAHELGAPDAAGHAAGADAGAEEAFVGVDVADAVEQRLVEQRGLDGQLAAAEELGEVFRSDGGGFGAGAGEGWRAGEFAQFQASEAAGIDETHFAAASQCEAGVGVRGDRGVGGGDQQPAGHAEMDYPLRGWGLAAGVTQVADDVFAYAADG